MKQRLHRNRSSTDIFFKFYRKLQRRKILMKFLQIIVLSILLTIWTLGSSLVIHIDTNLHRITAWRYKDIEEKQINLKRNIEKFCELKGNLKVKTNYSSEAEHILESAQKAKIMKENLLLIPELNQMWCLVPKAASTSWSKAVVSAINSDGMRLFVDERSQLPLQVILKQNYGYISKNVYEDALQSKNILKIVLARHPFARIASAYENKLRDRKAHKDGMYFFQRFGVKINRKFRTNNRLKQKEPTFAEFIQYLIDTNPMSYDEHWKPISLLCNVCRLNFHFVIKTEEMDEYSQYYLTQLGFDSNQSNHLPHENESNQTINSTSNWTKYFANITHSTMMKLYKKYEDDFELFQYSNDVHL